MDGSSSKIVAEFEASLKQTIRLAAEMQKQQQPNVPHMSVMEQAAHEVGQRVARGVLEQRMTEVAAECTHANCPTCSRRHEVQHRKRTITGSDGPVEIVEATAYCEHCRRAFFPAAANLRARSTRTHAQPGRLPHLGNG